MQPLAAQGSATKRNMTVGDFTQVNATKEDKYFRQAWAEQIAVK